MNIFQMMQSVKNPQMFLQQIAGNSQVMQNPMIKNAVDMAQRGDSQGLENLVRNIGQQKGVNVDDMINQVKSQVKF